MQAARALAIAFSRIETLWMGFEYCVYPCRRSWGRFAYLRSSVAVRLKSMRCCKKSDKGQK